MFWVLIGWGKWISEQRAHCTNTQTRGQILRTHKATQAQKLCVIPAPERQRQEDDKLTKSGLRSETLSKQKLIKIMIIMWAVSTLAGSHRTSPDYLTHYPHQIWGSVPQIWLEYFHQEVTLMFVMYSDLVWLMWVAQTLSIAVLGVHDASSWR